MEFYDIPFYMTFLYDIPLNIIATQIFQDHVILKRCNGDF